MTFRTVKSLFVVIGGLSRGGCETHLSIVLPELVKRGYDVEIFLLGFRGPLAEVVESQGVRITAPWIESDPSRQRALAFRLFRIIAVAVQLFFRLVRARPTIVHFFLPASYQLGGPVSLFAGRFIRLMSRRSLDNYKHGNRFLETLEAWLHGHMDVLLGNSAAVTAQLTNEAPSGTRIELIYNGVDLPDATNRKAPETRDSFGASPDQLLLCVVANLIPYKGHTDLLHAITEAAPQLPNGWVLVLAGRDDGHGPALKNLAAELGISDHIKFLGSYDNVPALLQASDIFILPSHQEGFSNALLEAMASQTAIIATDVGGNAEAIQHGMTGLIVPPRNPQALSHAIVTLAADPDKRATFARASAQRARDCFSLKSCIDNYDRLYMDMIAQRMGRARLSLEKR